MNIIGWKGFGRTLRAREIGIAVLILLLAVSTTLAQPDGFGLAWFTVDSGGCSSDGGVYTLSGTVGQPDANRALGGGDYTLVGGFWSGAGVIDKPDTQHTHLPLILKNHP
jgi:hypothetical protein